MSSPVPRKTRARNRRFRGAIPEGIIADRSSWAYNVEVRCIPAHFAPCRIEIASIKREYGMHEIYI